MSAQVLNELKAVLSAALEERRGLVVYSRLEPIEIDRLARKVERETLEKVQGLLPNETVDQRVLGLQNRLKRMQNELEQLGELGNIRDQSRSLQTDEIVWQAFEDVAWMLGVQ